MAYDPVKAHEYYIKYRKKKLLKGRKKGKAKTKTKKQKKAPTVSMLGVSSSGLNSDGAIEASVIKERLKKEMNEALQKASSEEEKLEIRKQYSKQANEEIAKLQSDPKYAKEKKTKEKTTKEKSSKSTKNQSSTSTTASAKATSDADAMETLKVVRDIGKQVNDIYAKMATMSPEEKAEARENVKAMIEELRKRIKK